MKVSFGIIGGSISGLATAISLRSKGFEVRVFERSKTILQGRGAGIGVSSEVLAQATGNKLLDKSIPHLPTITRSFLTKDLLNPTQTKLLIKNQPFSMIALNWQHIYTQLLSKLPQEFYHLGEPVKAISQGHAEVHLETDKAAYKFDYVIGADGINSSLRAHLFPNVKPHYADYIGWRGVCDDTSHITKTDFNQHAALYCFKGGHLVVYKIPAFDYAATGKEAVNWVLYEHRPGIAAQELLVDKNGTQRNFSIAPGMLSSETIEHIKAFANEKLPSNIATIISATKTPFAQGIYDLVVPNHVHGNFILLGDAAASLRPHVATGVVKALEGAMGLAQALDVSAEKRTDSLEVWNEAQKKKTQSLMELSKRFGDALVTASPDWTKMDESTTPQWWADLMQGKTWYATTGKPSFPR